MKWAKTSGTKRHKTHHDLISRCCAQRHLVRTLIELTDETKKKERENIRGFGKKTLSRKMRKTCLNLKARAGFEGSKRMAMIINYRTVVIPQQRTYASTIAAPNILRSCLTNGDSHEYVLRVLVWVANRIRTWIKWSQSIEYPNSFPRTRMLIYSTNLNN